MCHFNSNVIGQNESHGPQGAGKCKGTNGITGELTVSATVGFRDSREKQKNQLLLRTGIRTTWETWPAGAFIRLSSNSSYLSSISGSALEGESS